MPEYEVIAPGSSDLDGIRAAIFLKDGGVSLSDSASVQTGRGPGSRGVHCPGNGRGHGDDVGKGSMLMLRSPHRAFPSPVATVPRGTG